jgi:hypothetical protein
MDDSTVADSRDDTASADRISLPAKVSAYGAAAWGVAFAGIHLYWLLGGRVGLPAGQSLFDNLPLLIIDVIAIPLCLVAALLAYSLIRPKSARFGRRTLLIGAWGTAALLVGHALPATIDWGALLAGARTMDDLGSLERFSTLLYEPFFMAGGAFFAVAALCCQRRTR